MMVISSLIRFSIEFAAEPTRGVEPLDVRFTCEAFGSEFGFWYSVDYGDSVFFGSRNPVDQVYTYESYGIYDASCTATDPLGRSISSQVVPVVVLPDSDVSITPEDPSPDDQLTCIVDEYPDDVFDFEWHVNGDLLDRTTGSSSMIPARNAGDEVVCIAYLEGTIEEIGRDSVVVGDWPPLSGIEFSVVPSVGEAPLNVSYACEAFGGTPPYGYELEAVGSGGIATSLIAPEGAIVIHLPGTYEFSCVATDSKGRSLAASETVIVTPQDYEGDWSISADPLFGPAPLAVTFTADTSDIPIVGEVEWDFADGHTAFGSPRVHTFAKKGTYEVTATVRLEDGQVLTRSIVIVVTDREDPAIEIDASRVRITRAFAEVVGPDMVYATLTVKNDAGFTLRDMKATFQLPEYGVWNTRNMPDIPHGSSRTVSFFVPVDDISFETYAIFKAYNRDVGLERSAIVIR